MEIIGYLQQKNGAGVTEIATDLDLAKSTVHRHLSTLNGTGHVVKDGDMYKLGLKFLGIGEYLRNRSRPYRMAKSAVEELAAETEERTQFIVEENGWAVYVHRERGKHAVLTDPGIGRRVPIHCISAGKAVLAKLPEERVHEIIDCHGLPELTPNTITQREELLEELERIRERGYAFNNQENIEKLRAVGVAFDRPDGTVVGAFSVSGPIHRMKNSWYRQDIPDMLLGMANELELNIEYS
jgi:DNA-binding IclR family transcriptional regulator